MRVPRPQRRRLIRRNAIDGGAADGGAGAAITAAIGTRRAAKRCLGVGQYRRRLPRCARRGRRGGRAAPCFGVISGGANNVAGTAVLVTPNRSRRWTRKPGQRDGSDGSRWSWSRAFPAAPQETQRPRPSGPAQSGRRRRTTRIALLDLFNRRRRYRAGRPLLKWGPTRAG